MSRLRLAAACLVAALTFAVSPAEAEPAALGAGLGAQYYSQPAAQPTYSEQRAPSYYARQGRGLQYGLSLYVPIWIGETRDLGQAFAPGIGVAGRVGWEFGRGLSFELAGGISWNPTYRAYEYMELQNAFVNVGLRYAFLNITRLVPFLQGGVGLNFWDYCDRGLCTAYSEMSFGLFGGGGVIYEVNENVGIELGLNTNFAFRGRTFDKHQIAVQPFAGVTFYY